jgi:hypothetical protein
MARVVKKTQVIEKYLFYDIKSSKAMNNNCKKKWEKKMQKIGKLKNEHYNCSNGCNR